jgi:hypothetical protein
MKKALLVLGALLSIVFLSACGSSSMTEPTPTPSLSFEELQSQYVQELGAKGCIAFMSGQYQIASKYFFTLETIVPEWSGYAAGVLRKGKAFDAALCF